MADVEERIAWAQQSLDAVNQEIEQLEGIIAGLEDGSAEVLECYSLDDIESMRSALSDLESDRDDFESRISDLQSTED